MLQPSIEDPPSLASRSNIQVSRTSRIGEPKISCTVSRDGEVEGVGRVCVRSVERGSCVQYDLQILLARTTLSLLVGLSRYARQQCATLLSAVSLCLCVSCCGLCTTKCRSLVCLCDRHMHLFKCRISSCSQRQVSQFDMPDTFLPIHDPRIEHFLPSLAR